MGSAEVRASPVMSANRSRWQWFSTNLAINTALVVFNAALIGIIWAVFIAVVRVEREQTIRAAINRIDNLAIAFEHYASRTIDSADSVLRSLIREHARRGESLDLIQFISENRIGNEFVSVALANERGDATLAAKSVAPVRANIADREHFRVHVDRDDGKVFIGKPVTGRLTSKAVVPLTRRFSKQDGSFGGVAMVVIEPSSFTAVLRDAQLPPLDVLSLVGLDGIARARLMGTTVSSGEDLSKRTLIATELAKRRVGSYISKGHLDGVPRFFSYRMLPNYDLVATVGTPEAEVMAGFHQRRARYLWAAGLASVAIAGFALLLMLALASRKLTEEAMRQQHALLANAQRVGGMGIFELDVARNRVTWSAETYRIFGVDPEGFGGTFEAFIAFVHPADTERLRSLYSHPPPDGSAAEAEYRIVRPNGEQRVVFERGEITLDATGHPLRKLGVLMDVTDMRRTEVALREAEEKYRSIFENSTEGIFQNTPDGRLLAANPAIARMLGFESPEELIGERTDLERQSYADPALRDDFRRRLEERGFLNGFEYEVRRKDGSTIWVSENVRVVRDAGGQPLRYEGSVQDITERRRAQEALRESEEGFRTLAEAMPQIVWTAGPDGRAVHFNRKWMDYTGLTLVESVSQGWLAPSHPYDRTRAVEGWQRATAAGEACEIEYRLRRADGVYHWMLGRALPLRDGGGSIVKWFGTCTDIHDLKLVQQEITRVNGTLQQQKSELRALFDLVPAMIWFKDTFNGILRVNKRVADAAGMSVDDIEGKPSADIYPLDAAKYYADDLEVIRSGVPKLGIVETLKDQEGNMVWVQTDKVPYRDETGKVIGIVVMGQDISARKRSEAELLKTHRELLEVSRSAGRAEVATNVLHNVGNVLNSVNVSADLLLESVRNSRAARMAEVVALMGAHKPDLGHYITSDPRGQHIPAVLEKISTEWAAQQNVLVAELESLRGNIDHIKQIVAMQQGHAKVSGAPESVNVADLVEDTLRVQGDASIEHPVRIIREFEDMPAIQVEKHKVLQILVNLVRNARLACAEQGETDQRITLQTAQVDGRLRIVVSDNGSGIAPENLTRIFSHGFTTRKDGHGFGLHSGALAAAELGGSLSAQSDGPGKGATFTLDLPMHPPGVRA